MKSLSIEKMEKFSGGIDGSDIACGLGVIASVAAFAGLFFIPVAAPLAVTLITTQGFALGSVGTAVGCLS